MNEIEFLKIKLQISENESKEFANWINMLGIDKCLEIYHNFVSVTNIEEPTFESVYSFYVYDTSLSEILFTLLRHSENHIKGFLSNVFNNYKVQIESRPSNYTKTKYYFKIPVGINEYLDIRTHNYDRGPVDYYDAIKTLDFGDVNLIMSHLPSSIISKFSSNSNIIKELDYTRKLRNYVYHHNLLFSLGLHELKEAIRLVLNNLPYDNLRIEYKEKINSLRNKDNLIHSIKIN